MDSKSLQKVISKNFIFIFVLAGLIVAVLVSSLSLSNIFPLTGKRFIISTIASGVAGTAISYWSYRRIVVPGYSQIDKKVRKWFIVCVILFGIMIPFVSLDFSWLRNRHIHFLLPKQTLEVRAIENPSEPASGVTLVQLKNQALGEVNFDALIVHNWKRINDELVNIKIDDNFFSWQGRTGENAAVVFKTSTLGGLVKVRWNGVEENYQLASDGEDEIQIRQTFEVPFYASWKMLLIFIELFSIYSTLVVFLAALRIRPSNELPKRIPSYQWLLYAAPMAIVWAIYLLVFWPGLMTVDSFDQWRQMTSWEFVDWHPPFHTLLNWLITRVWNSPAAIALFQIILMSSAAGWALTTIRKLGTPKWIAWFTSVVMAIMPANGMLVITIWKDITFSISLVAFTICVLAIISSRGKWLTQRRNLILLAIVMVFICLLRQNGFLIVIGTLFFLIPVIWHSKKTIGISFVIFLILYGLIKGPLYTFMQVTPNNMARFPTTLMNLIAAHTQSGTLFTSEERNILFSAYPRYPLPYNCYRNKALIYEDEHGNTLNLHYLEENTSLLFKMAINLTLRNPQVTIQHFACNGNFVYKVYMVPWYTSYQSTVMEISPNEFGFKTSTMLPGIMPLLTNFIKMTLSDERIYFWVWRMPFWMYLLGGGCIVFCFRQRQWSPLIVLMPGLLCALPYIILTLGQIFRYVYPMYLIGILFCGYFWFGNRFQSDEKGTPIISASMKSSEIAAREI